VSKWPFGFARPTQVDEPAEPEVPERASRRVFSAQYKLRILAEYERRDRDGPSALLRREGLYTSSISEWRRQREEGALQALGGTRGRPPADPREREVVRLRQEVARLHGELGKAQRVINVLWRYQFSLPDAIARSAFRPLRDPSDFDDDDPLIQQAASEDL
jgi:transposase-like protein